LGYSILAVLKLK